MTLLPACSHKFNLPSAPSPLPTATPTPTVSSAPNPVATALATAPNFNLTSGVTTLTTGLYYFSCVHIGAGAVVTISGGVTLFTPCFVLDAGGTITGVGQGYGIGGAIVTIGSAAVTYGSGAGPGGGTSNMNGGGSSYTSGGGGHGGAGGTDSNYACMYAPGGTANDDPVHPALMGSGGASPYGIISVPPFTSAGGGLIKLVVYDPVHNVLAPCTVNGTIDMSGNSGCFNCGLAGEGGGGGAGGTILLESSDVQGTGILRADGGPSGGEYGNGGGGIISLIENPATFGGMLSVAPTSSTTYTLGTCSPVHTGFPGIVTFTAAPSSGF